MRTATLAMLAAFVAATPASAADLGYDFLRGADYDEPALAPVPLIDWSGFYIGGHGGYSNASLGFKNVFQPMIFRESHDSTAETELGASTLLNPASRRIGGASYGAYAGVNFQYGDVVFGFEGDYTYASLTGRSIDSIGRFKTNALGLMEYVGLGGIASTRIEDYGTVRARIGYAYGSFLPYVTGGFAIGRAQIADRVSYQNYGYNLATFNANQAQTTGNPAYVTNFGYVPGTFSQSNPSSGVPITTQLTQHRSKTVAGFALGTGLEYAVTPNIILRGEYQYVLFDAFDGHKANVNTVRGGAAVKF